MARQMNTKFGDIVHAYKDYKREKLQKQFPLYSAILEMVVKHIPNPLDAQKYRMEKIWKGNIRSEVGQAIANCDDNGPTLVSVTNIQTEPNQGLIATGRVYSGTVKSGDKVYLINARTESMVQQVYIYMGAFRDPVDQVSAGNLVALSGLELAKVGETLVDNEYKEAAFPFEQVRYISEPVVTVAVEPKNPAELPQLLQAVDQLAKEDPNITTALNSETGECLLSGMGELHLEIVVKQLRDMVSGTKISTSSPRVVYRENVSQKGITATACSPNRKNKFAVQVEPLDKALIIKIEKETSNTRNIEDILAFDDKQNVLVDCTGKTEQFRELLDFIISGFRFACQAGPLCGEPMGGVKINLMKIQVDENIEYRNPLEVMHGVGKAIFGSFLTATPMLLEPVYRTIVSSPNELAGECSRIIISRRGKISAFEQKDFFTIITSYIPVADTFGLSSELRSATSGRAFWQSSFARWEKVPKKLEVQIVKKVRKRKGLPSEVPNAKWFMEEDS